MTTSVEMQPRKEIQGDVPAQDTAAPATFLDEATDDRQEFSLPPVDGGKDAWLFLTACFVMECLVWGFPFAFGIFQDYYRTHEPFAGSPHIAVIGTCAMGIMYLSTPVIMILARLYPAAWRWGPTVGLVIMCCALAASSFATTTWHLIVTQGVLFAIGGAISYTPCILYVDEWFVRRKGLAFGVMWSGTGLGGCTIPLLLEFLLQKVGFRTTMRIWSGMLFALSMPLVYFVRPRLPTTSSASVTKHQLRTLRQGYGFVRDRGFLLYQLANIIEGVGFFLPGIYLPSYARTEFGASSFPAAVTVLAVNVASVAGTVAMGALTDKLDVTTCILISTVGAAFGVFILWGLASSLAMLYVSCVVYGLFAGSYTATWPGIMKQVAVRAAASGESSGGAFDPVMVFGMLAAGRGVGNIISGPMSEALIEGMPWRGQAAAGYGSGYGTLITFTGVTAVIGGGSFVWKRLGWM